MDINFVDVVNINYVDPNLTHNRTVEELRDIIRKEPFIRYFQQRPHGWYKLRKAELVDFINRHIQEFNTQLRERRRIEQERQIYLEMEQFFANFNDYDFESPRERESINIVERNHAFKGMVTDIKFRNHEQFDLALHFDLIRRDFVRFIFENNNNFNFRISMCTCFNLINTRTNDNKIFYIRSRTHSINKTNYSNIFNEMVAEIMNSFEDRITESTQWRFENIEYTTVNRDVNQPLFGASYIEYKNRNCINIKNDDNYCILYVILYNLHKNELNTNPQRASKYKEWLNDILNDDKFKNLNITFPFEITEGNAKLLEDYFNITMHIYVDQKDKQDKNYNQIQLVFRSNSFEKDSNRIHVDILHLTDKKNNSHFVCIKNLSGFLSGKIHHQDKHLIICKKCFNHKFKNEDELRSHEINCFAKSTDELLQYDLPEEDENVLKYKTKGAEVYHPFVNYLDFECLLEKCNIKKQNTDLISKHVANSFGIYNNYNKEYDQHIATGDALVQNFHIQLKTLAQLYHKLRKTNESAIKDPESNEKFEKTNECEICHETFNSEPNDNFVQKCFDHDHLTGKYRMALCKKCNFECEVPDFLPIIVHNLKGYDSKLIIKELDKIDGQQTAEEIDLENKKDDKKEITVIATSVEKYRQFRKKIKVGEEKRKKCLRKGCLYKYNFPEKTKCKECKNENLEEYQMPISIELRFIDSFEFIPTSLDKAIKNLLNLNGAYCNHCKKVREIKNCNFEVINNEIFVTDICNFCDEGKQIKKVDYNHLKNFNHVFKDSSKEEICFLLRKGVYPYEFIDSMDKLDLTELPKFEDFHSNLSGNISKNDYKFAQKLWNYYKNKNNGNWSFRDYHSLYLKLDVILLADVYDNFREMCYKNYQLDPIHFVSAPHLSFNACMKFTRQKLELITDKEMYFFYEKGIRGGISQIIHSYEKANNCYYFDDKIERVYKLAKEDAEKKGIYDSKKLISYILYLDANNLYGWAQSQKMPINNHRWLNEEEIQYYSDPQNLLRFDSDGDECINLEVDLEVPENLHDFFNDYAPAPNHESPKILSGFQNELINKNLGSKQNKYQKLLCTLEKKENYIIHIKLLQEYLKNGIKLLKVHRGTISNQKAWLKSYIEKNTELRKEAKNDFEKDFFKLMNNSVFGKQMENVRNRINLRIINREEIMRKQIPRSQYQNRHIIDKNIVIISGRSQVIKLNKPLFGGMCILDLSKLLMFKFYVEMKKKYGDRVKLLGTDTDSFIFYFEGESINDGFDIYENMKNDMNTYDTSDLIDDFPVEGLKSNVNKKIPGKFKDEYNGIPIREFCGLRSKMYSFKTDHDDKKVCKGIKKINIKSLRFEDYKNCIDTLKQKMETIYNIRSFKLGLFTTKEIKVGLSPYDDKFFMYRDENNKIIKLAHGHYKINEIIENEIVRI